jgi:hypothetical protein
MRAQTLSTATGVLVGKCTNEANDGHLVHQLLVAGVLLRPNDEGLATVRNGRAFWITDQALEVLSIGNLVMILNGALDKPAARERGGDVFGLTRRDRAYLVEILSGVEVDVLVFNRRSGLSTEGYYDRGTEGGLDKALLGPPLNRS